MAENQTMNLNMIPALKFYYVINDTVRHFTRYKPLSAIVLFCLNTYFFIEKTPNTIIILQPRFIFCHCLLYFPRHPKGINRRMIFNIYPVLIATFNHLTILIC